ncbi:hypothetical protein [Rufibacter hautae]|uniref:XRE family transcriptional regulator n=1 Tax=Rufibacter hautae TaxID=2595005 RepID=A0A5B6TGM2_9BACT|nr:hypothetical protein [Rufibacter hautae]KAA3438340.1 hypothetical protein FOA19_13915 [Rufibacter hautae]
MSDLLTRIQEVISWCALGPAAFADEIEVGRPVISHILSARNKASLEVVQKILSRFPEVSALWLISGEGEMLNGLAMDPGSSQERKVQPFLDAHEVKTSRIGQIKHEVQKSDVMKKVQDEILFSPKREVVKVMLLYSDGSFESYEPS